jgi:hypothetical protein
MNLHATRTPKGPYKEQDPTPHKEREGGDRMSRGRGTGQYGLFPPLVLLSERGAYHHTNDHEEIVCVCASSL